MTTVGIIGAGQLALMLGEAGTHIDVAIRTAGTFGSPAFTSCEAFTDELTSPESLDDFLRGIDVFTFESEHEGLDYVDAVSAHGIDIYPSPQFVRIAGDRLLEKTHLASLDIPTAPFFELQEESSAAALDYHIANVVSTQQLSPHGVVIKTRHGGYDGKGQWVIRTGDNTDFGRVATQILPVLTSPGCIIEGLVDFICECSIIATRSRDGQCVTWPITHNIHVGSILRESYAPITSLDHIAELQEQATQIATQLLTTSEYVGTIAVECFVTNQGLIVNEIAPRVHNSGHWTIEGAATSQFEQHLRAITGQNLGDTSPLGYSAMINVVGESFDLASLQGHSSITAHWYGKEVRPERKVGHITIVGETPEHRDELVTLTYELTGLTRPE